MFVSRTKNMSPLEERLISFMQELHTWSCSDQILVDVIAFYKLSNSTGWSYSIDTEN